MLLLACLVSNISTARAQEEDANIFGNSTLPNWLNVTVTETANFIIVDNNDGFTYKFRVGSAGYNEIWENTSLIVANEQWILQYLSGPRWKQRGIPQNVSWEQPESYHVVVKRFYDDFLGTTFNVTYSFHGGFRPKIAFEGFIGQEDLYRIKWAISGINKTYVSEKQSSVEFWNEDEIPIAFDYEDVYTNFGDITSIEIVPWANDHKLNEIFNIGALSIGEFTLDPTFGKTGVGGSSTTVFLAWQKLASRYTSTGTGNITELSWYGKSAGSIPASVACVYANNASDYPSDLLGTSDSLAMDTTVQWWNFTFSTEVEITDSTVYWLGLLFQGFAPTYYYDAGSSHQWVRLQDVAPPNDPFGEPQEEQDRAMSIYATYTVSGEIRSFYGSLTLNASLSAEGSTWQFSRQSSITQAFAVNGLKTMAFTVEGLITPTFAIAGSFTTGAFLNVFGSLTQQFTVDTVKTIAFSISGIINPVFGINGLATLTGNVLTFSGTLTQTLSLAGWNDLPVVPVDISTASAGFVIIALSIALCALAIALKSFRTQKDIGAVA